MKFFMTLLSTLVLSLPTSSRVPSHRARQVSGDWKITELSFQKNFPQQIGESIFNNYQFFFPLLTSARVFLPTQSSSRGVQILLWTKYFGDISYYVPDHLVGDMVTQSQGGAAAVVQDLRLVVPHKAGVPLLLRLAVGRLRSQPKEILRRTSVDISNITLALSP